MAGSPGRRGAAPHPGRLKPRYDKSGGMVQVAINTLFGSSTTRRELLTSSGAVALAAIGLPKLAGASAPASTVAIVRCRNYQDDVTGKLSEAFDKIGGIEKLVRGKTVAIKLNLTGNPKNWPLTPELPYRTDPSTVASTVHLLAKAGARPGLSRVMPWRPAGRHRYGVRPGPAARRSGMHRRPRTTRARRSAAACATSLRQRPRWRRRK